MSDARFLYTLSWPEGTKVEIIVKCLNTDRSEYDYAKSDCKAGLNDIEPPEHEKYDSESYHEP